MKKYNIIYADPPWCYNNKSSRGAAENHYSTMSIEEIKNLNVKNISDVSCALFLWVTFPFLKGGLEVMESWGFIYKTVGFVWIKTYESVSKPYFGIGNYTKSNSEICLLGIKGKMKVKVIDNTISSVIVSAREEHSKKPNLVRENIVKLFGDLPRMELFARKQYCGWDVYGNEITSNIKL